MKPSEIDLEKLKVREGEGVLTNLIGQRARLSLLQQRATELGDVRGAIAAEKVVLSNLEATGKLLGEFVDRKEITTTSFLVSPDYVRLRTIIIEKLKDYPDAARALAVAFADLEQEQVPKLLGGPPGGADRGDVDC